MLTLARRLLAPVAVASTVLLSSSLLAPLPGGATTRPDPHRLVKLAPAPGVPASSHRVGRVAANRIFHLEIGLLPRDPASFQRFLDGVTTPGSPTFRHYLAPGAYALRFGPTPASVAPLVAALRSHGLSVRPLDRARQSLSVTGTASAVESFFHTGLASFATSSGPSDFAATGAPRVEARFRPLIAGVSGLTSFGRRTPAASHQTPLTVGTAPSCTAATNLESAGMGVSTTKLASGYGINSLYSQGIQGEGVTVGVYELSAFKPSDLTTYKNCFGISPTVKVVNVDGGPTPYSAKNSVDAIEPTLDIQEMLSLAPKANYIVYQGPNASAHAPSGPNDLLAAIADADVAQVVSMSWGICEQDNPDPGGVHWENTVFQQMAAQGQTFVAASGDSGTADCAKDGTTPTNTGASVDDPASQPYVTGVGATRMLSASPLSQTAWGSGTLGGRASGGGVSSVWSRPAWQQMASSDPVVTSSTRRLVPDVSLNGDPRTGVLIYQFDSGGWFSVGGTSAASPLLAALIALADSNCQTSVGFLNPQLYALSASTPSAFSDTTTGSNSVGTSTTYLARPGYDLATGLGTPLASLLTGLCTAAPSASQTSVLAGKITTISAHIATPVQLQAGDTVKVSLPSGDTAATNAGSVTVTANGTTGPLTLLGTSVGTASTTRNAYTFTVQSTIEPGSTLAFTFSNVLNRV
ncbi:MAG: S53 family peptidase, partial [Actinomycetota bacterium]